MSTADCGPVPVPPCAVPPLGWGLPRQARAAALAAQRLHGGGEPAFIARLAVELVERELADASSALFACDGAGVVSQRAAGPRWRTDEREDTSWLLGQTGAIARLVRTSSTAWGRLAGARDGGGRLEAPDLGLVPVTVGGRPWGLLVVAWRAQPHEREGDQWFLQRVAIHVGLALERATVERRLAAALASSRAAADDELRLARLDALACMAAAVAHDLSNALTTIVGLTDWTLETLPPGAEQRPDIETVAEAARNATAMLGRLRVFASAGCQADRDACRLDDLAAAACESMASAIQTAAAEGRPVHVERRHAGESLVTANPEDLVAAARELLQNAIEAMPSGGRVVVSTGEDAGEAFLSVSDQGEGVPVEVRERLGEPFVSTRGRRSRGLGFSVCWRVARAHGGRLSVESTPGRGSVVTLWLPRENGASGVDPTGPPSRPRGRVLVVDDDEDVRVTVAGMLSVLGWGVTAVGGVEEALAQIDGGHPDAVMTDFAMPGKDGLDLARELRRRGVAAPVAIFTGVGAEFSPDALTDVQAVVAKPLTLDGLARMLDVLTAVHGEPSLPSH
jgi:signal transduction histidine kinase/CheY-like chemotaxis protein